MLVIITSVVQRYISPPHSSMAYFEVCGGHLSWQQLQSQAVSHYVSQAVQQAYVLVLGLDVLGNPYGLVRDFTQGMGDFFYEPFMVSVRCRSNYNIDLDVLCFPVAQKFPTSTLHTSSDVH